MVYECSEQLYCIYLEENQDGLAYPIIALGPRDVWSPIESPYREFDTVRSLSRCLVHVYA